MEPKGFLRSKRVWANGLTLLVFGAALFGVIPDAGLIEKLKDSAPVWLPILNLILVKFSEQPVTFGRAL